MVACEKDVCLLLDDVSLVNNEDAEPVVLLPGGGQLRLEWTDDAPEIDAIMPIDDAVADDAVAVTCSFDE